MDIRDNKASTQLRKRVDERIAARVDERVGNVLTQRFHTKKHRGEALQYQSCNRIAVRQDDSPECQRNDSQVGRVHANAECSLQGF